MSRQNKMVAGLMAAMAVLVVVAFILLRSGPAPTAERPTEVAMVQPPTAPIAPEAPRVVSSSAALPEVELVAEEREAVEATAAPGPAPVAQAAVAAEPATSNAMVRVTVLEQGSRKPLSRVRVRLVNQADAESEGNRPPDWGRGGPPGGFEGFGGGWGMAMPGMNGRTGGADPFDMMTDENGVVLFKNVRTEAQVAWARYGQGPRVSSDNPVYAQQNRTIDLRIDYPAPQPFKFRLLDETKNPVTNEAIEVGTALFPGDAMRSGSLTYSPTVTDGQGYFYISSYEGIRGASIRSTKNALFTASEPGTEDRSRGRRRFDSGWMNPFFLTDDLEADEEYTIYMRTDVVVATAHLKNAPKLQEGSGYTASVRTQTSFYPLIPVENDQFTFTANKNESAEINITERVSGEGFFGRDSLHKTMTQQLPTEPGPYEFDIEFAKSRRVDGYVYRYNGTPAENVRVIANSFGTAGAGTSALESSSNSNRRSNRGGGGFRESWRGPREDGQPSLVSKPTDTTGHFTFELQENAEYLFGVDTDTLPEDSKGGDAIVKSWDEIEKGTPIVLTLKASSIIWGEVRDASGQPAANVQVTLRGPDIPWNSPDFRTSTDETGMFELNIPPVRLPQVDPNEPPAHYVFAWHTNMGGGLGKVVIDDAEKPVEIKLSPFAAARVRVTEAGAPVTEIEFLQLYTVPGFSVPITARSNGRRSNDQGVYDFPALIKGVSSVTIWKRGADEAGTKSVFIEENAPDLVERQLDLTM